MSDPEMLPVLDDPPKNGIWADGEITMTVLAIKAVVAALKQYPNFNSSLDSNTDEIILKQVHSILHTKYAGDLLRFCGAVQAKDLLAPLTDTVGKRTFTISVLQPLGAVYSASPYLITMRYLAVTGEDKKYALPIGGEADRSLKHSA